MPSPPGDDDEDFILVHHSDVQISEKAEQVYVQLAKILKEQYEVKKKKILMLSVKSDIFTTLDLDYSVFFRNA